MKSREVGKFLSGIAASQVMSHGGLALSGERFDMFGISYDPGLNWAATGFWAFSLVALVYYSWFSKRR
jgi:hypothetical protein